MTAAVLATLLLMQDSSLEEILREFEQARDEARLSRQLRELPGEALPDMARRVAEGSGGGMTEPDRLMLEILGEALADPNTPASSRLDLAELLRSVTGVDLTATYAEIATGSGEPIDRLRALGELRTLDPDAAAEIAPEVIRDFPLTTLRSEETFSQVVSRARAGDEDARDLLLRAAQSESLPPETRLAAAESLRTLEGVADVDQLLRSIASLEKSEDENIARRARDLGRDLRTEPDIAVRVLGKKDRRRHRPPAAGEHEESSTLHRNLTFLSLAVLLGALLVVRRRRA